MKIEKRYAWPVSAVLIGGFAAWFTQSTPNAAAVVAPVGKDRGAVQIAAFAADPGEAVAADEIHGKVLETIAVPNYTYLRIAASARPGTTADEMWAAVPTTDVKVGDAVTVVGAQRMDHFTSTTLKRDFDTIYFGALKDSRTSDKGSAVHPSSENVRTAMQTSDGALPAGHPPIGSLGGEATATSGDPDSTEIGAQNPHARPESAGDSVAVTPVSRAAGKLGRTVAEVHQGKQRIAGQRVRVRGVVVKSTSGILGKSFVHLRDGTGDSKAGDHDLTVTTDQGAVLGATLTFEGTVVMDKDFGAGYRYAVLLENSNVVTE